jgi:hypothetical protein
MTAVWALVAVVAGAVALVADRRPLYVLAATGLCVFAFFPRLCRLVFTGAVAVAAVFNPPVLGLGAGRIYLVQGLLLLTFVGAIALAVRTGLHRKATLLLVLTLVLIAVETVGRPDAGLAWVYRPLQVFFVSFTVLALFRGRNAKPLVLALAWGSTIGCTLASVHALLPDDFDPFRFSRPEDIPFVSAIGGFARATGAFTYPNNLGSYAAYAVLFGASAWLFGRPAMSQRLAVAVMLSGASALALAASRAAGLGLLVGILYLTYQAALRRRMILICVEVLIGLLVVSVVLSSPTAREVSSQRIESATGESLAVRIDDWRDSLGEFRESPLIGTGASESRTDNFWLLYMAQAGAVGVLLLLLLARTTFWNDPEDGPPWAPELRVALLLALCVSGLLQDSLGQTLTTWFLGALIGVSILRAPAPVEDTAVSAAPGSFAAVAMTARPRTTP